MPPPSAPPPDFENNQFGLTANGFYLAYDGPPADGKKIKFKAMAGVTVLDTSIFKAVFTPGCTESVNLDCTLSLTLSADSAFCVHADTPTGRVTNGVQLQILSECPSNVRFQFLVTSGVTDYSSGELVVYDTGFSVQADTATGVPDTDDQFAIFWETNDDPGDRAPPLYLRW